jgi:hypothetical protein
MDRSDPTPGDEIEADVADVLEQAEPPASEPVDEALQERDAIVARDPESTGLEAEAAEDSGQA